MYLPSVVPWGNESTYNNYDLAVMSSSAQEGKRNTSPKNQTYLTYLMSALILKVFIYLTLNTFSKVLSFDRAVNGRGMLLPFRAVSGTIRR